MSLHKLRTELTELLPEFGITTLNSLENKVIDSIKSGKNAVVESGAGTGKTTSAMLTVFQRITEPGEGSPRCIVICADDQRANELHSRMDRIAKRLDLTLDLAHEKGNILQQRNDIFDGTEIIIGTPKRIYDLYIQNGFNVGKIKLFVLDDASELMKGNLKMHITRLVESLPKCQHLILTRNVNDRKLEDYLEEVVPVRTFIEDDQP